MIVKGADTPVQADEGALVADGVSLHPVPGRAGAKALKARYADLPTLNKMRGKVRKHYAGMLDGRALTLFEHSYVVQAGSVPVPVSATVYAVAAADWPGVLIEPRKFWSRLMLRLGRPASGVQVERADFNYAFHVSAEDESFAITLLSPEMQALLLEKRSVRWRIRGGEVALIYSGNLNVKRIGGSLDRLRRFWSLVPPELEAWARAPAAPGA